MNHSTKVQTSQYTLSATTHHVDMHDDPFGPLVPGHSGGGRLKRSGVVRGFSGHKEILSFAEQTCPCIYTILSILNT